MYFIPTLQDLSGHVDLDQQYISNPVAAVDKRIMSRQPTSQKYMTGEQKSTTPTDKQASAGLEPKEDKQTSETTGDSKQVPGAGDAAVKNEE